MNHRRALLISTILYSSIASGKPSVQIPKVFFEHSYPYDLYCPKPPQPENPSPECPNPEEPPITPAMQEELAGLLPELQRQWDDLGVKLLSKTIELMSKKFNRQELSASLTLCPWNIPTSYPLLIAVRPYLKSASDHPRSRTYLMSMVYHELLHRYLMEAFPDILVMNTPLLKKYKKEDGVTLVHLHVFAIQKAVFLAMNRQDLLNETIINDSKIPHAGYRRGWEIVNDIEGYLPFITEILSQ
ncbi:MAG: hypothetical protein AB7T49_07725 [Oligoflexales bacterium]